MGDREKWLRDCEALVLELASGGHLDVWKDKPPPSGDEVGEVDGSGLPALPYHWVVRKIADSLLEKHGLEADVLRFERGRGIAAKEA